MKVLDSVALRFDGVRLEILDQRFLPDKECWCRADSPEQMAAHIRVLAVRGAPLIGVAAALSLGLYARTHVTDDVWLMAAKALRLARPTAVNLMTAVDRVVAAFGRGGRDSAFAEAFVIFDEDVSLCEKMAEHGASLIQEGDGVITHCNAGALATAGVGTALGAVIRAHKQGKKIHVYVDETRPLLQGARLTAWELQRAGVPHTLMTDSMAALVMRDGRAKKIFVGADRIARNGDFANKVGTYGLAVCAKFHDVGMYVVAPVTTVDLATRDGSAIPIEERLANEVRGVEGAFGSVRWSPENTSVYNPSFDVTPVNLVTALVLDCGVYSRDELMGGALPHLLGV
jgi:methylthioribose-1-phosphate isomerase